ncbi:hypothetical protein P886_0530 [Alteromonadaceae bacterium 2753L.S.0a.02]|nr:hypothetical protein P886_0530 [Alteromonadaceae bacterium 2753L.S.0a.02]
MKGESLLSLGHQAMLTTLVLSVIAAIAAYGASDHLPLGSQISAHLLLLVLPVFLKLGYIMRLTALRHLGRAAH